MVNCDHWKLIKKLEKLIYQISSYPFSANSRYFTDCTIKFLMFQYFQLICSSFYNMTWLYFWKIIQLKIFVYRIKAARNEFWRFRPSNYIYSYYRARRVPRKYRDSTSTWLVAPRSGGSHLRRAFRSECHPPGFHFMGNEKYEWCVFTVYLPFDIWIDEIARDKATLTNRIRESRSHVTLI